MPDLKIASASNLIIDKNIKVEGPVILGILKRKIELIGSCLIKFYSLNLVNINEQIIWSQC
jgi:hypothetical protein